MLVSVAYYFTVGFIQLVALSWLVCLCMDFWWRYVEKVRVRVNMVSERESESERE